MTLGGAALEGMPRRLRAGVVDDRLNLGLLLLLAIAAAGLVTLILWHLDHNADREEAAISAGATQTDNAVAAVNEQFAGLAQVARDVAADLSSGDLSVETLKSRLQADHAAHPGFWGVGVVYEAGTLPRLEAEPDADLRAQYQADLEYLERVDAGEAPISGERLATLGIQLHPDVVARVEAEGGGLADAYRALAWNPYYTRPGGRNEYTPVNYNPGLEARGAWYTDPRDQGSFWNAPYFGGTSQKMVAEFGAAFTPAGETDPAGIVFTNFTLDQLNGNVSWLSLGGSGYGFLVAEKPILGEEEHIFVVHPRRDYWFADPSRPDGVSRTTLRYRAEPQTLADGSATPANAGLQELDRRLRAGEESGRIAFVDGLTGREAWLFFRQIPETGWTLASVVIQSEVLGLDDTSRRQLMGIGTVAILGLFALGVLVVRRFGGVTWTLWSASILFAVLMVGGIAFFWSLAQQRPESNTGLNASGASLRDTVVRYENSLRDNVAADVKPIEVFAGTFVQSVDFTADNEIEVTGIAWQRYTGDAADMLAGDQIRAGFIFPEDVSISRLEPLYREADGRNQTVGWAFRVTLPESFQLQHFPFDRQVVPLRMWHEEFERPIVLIPDIPEYDLIVPVEQPGLNERFFLGGWDVDSSFFSYHEQGFNTRFGIPGFTRSAGAPDLYFNVLLKRQFLDTFVSRMLPVIVVSVLVFAVLMAMTRLQERVRSFGTTLATTLSSLGALMFVLIVGHNNLRGDLSAAEIVYLEYFYFVMYVVILAVAVNGILFLAGSGGTLIQQRDNLLARTAFWPVVTAATFLFTWLVFY